MAPPDLNSLPPSRSMSSSPMQSRAMSLQTAVPPPVRQDTPSPRASSLSLATAAITNAANESRRSSLSNRGSPRLGRMPSDRRRSQAAMSLNLNDPTLPSPGELSGGEPRHAHSFVSASPPTIGGRSVINTGDPHHQRQPSLGDIHNELEQEQEAQVNRMLQMIREQQLQLDALRNSQQEPPRRPSQPSGPAAAANGTAVIDDDMAPSDRAPLHAALPPVLPPPTRRFSRGQSDAAPPAPALRPLPGHDSSQSTSGDWPPSPVDSVARRNSFRDETAFYQAETANLSRENQMLRLRIRELERQIGEMTTAPANAPPIPSTLVTSRSLAADADASTSAAIATVAPEQEKD